MKVNRAQILRWATRLRTSPFLGNITKLVSGEVISQAVALASIPVLTRLYGPSAFGILGVFIALSEVGGKMSTLRYDVALVLPEEDRKAWALLRFSAMCSLALTLLLLLGSYPFRQVIAVKFGSEELALYFPVIALMMLAIGWQSLASFWSMREKHFRAIAQSSAGSSIIGNSFKIAAGFLGCGAGGLLVGTAIQRWSNLFILRFTTPAGIWKNEVEQGEGKRQAILYNDFPKYRMPQDTLSNLTRQLPNILLASFFSPAVAGFYILATRILQLPFSLLQEAIRKVFYIKAVEVDREGDSLFRLCIHMTLLIAVGMLPVVFVIFGWGTYLFELLFGDEWSTTGSYAKWVILLVTFRFCSIPSSVVIPIIGWNRFYLIFESVSTVVRLSLIIAAAMTMSANATVATIALTTVLSSVVLMGIVLLHLHRAGPTPNASQTI